MRKCLDCNASIAKRGPSAVRCEPCAKEYRKGDNQERQRAYRQNHEAKERLRAYDKARRQRPEVKERQKAYDKARGQRPEVKERSKARGQTAERKAYLKAYNQRPESKVRKLAYYREYYDDPERNNRKNELQLQRYYRLGGLKPRRNVGGLVEAQGSKCGICHRRLPKSLRYIHVDHIVPVSLGGRSEIANLQAVHLKCNLRKHNNIGAGVAPKLIEVT